MRKFLLLFVLSVASFSLVMAQNPQWIEIFPSGTPPIPRVLPQFAYDAVNDRLVFFSGSLQGTSEPHPPDVWVLENATDIGGAAAWLNTIPTTASPPPFGRHNGTMVYDPNSNRANLHGACGPFQHCSPGLKDTWVLTNANGIGGASGWIQLPDAPNDSFDGLGRISHSSVYDPGSNRMIVFAGHRAFTGTDQNLVWILENANGIGVPAWVELFPSGTPPTPRASHGAAYDPGTNRMIVFGGQKVNVGPQFNDVWVLTNANGLGGTPQWVQLNPIGSAPPPRRDHVVAYNPATNRLIVFGGFDDATSTYYNDVWVLTEANGTGGVPEWIQQAPSGGPPAVRIGAMAAYSSASNRLVVAMGGNASNPFLPDVWVLTDADGTSSFEAFVQQPIDADGSSVFSAKKGAIPVKFTLTKNGVTTCELPPATIAVNRTAGGTILAVDESVYLMSADTGSNFRISDCQYVYNLKASALGSGTYEVGIVIGGSVVGTATFQLK
jgi:hypothetical protein